MTMRGVPASTCFSPHLTQLRICGYITLNDDMKRYRPYHNVLHHALFVLVFVYIVQIFLFAYSTFQVDPEKSIQSMVIFFSFLPAFGKFALVRYREKKILDIIGEFDDPLFNQDHEIHKTILEASAINATRILRMFHAGGMITSVVWTLFPLIEFVMNGESSLDCTFGFDYNKTPHFYIALFYTKIILFLAATGNTACDCLISAILGQCGTQITLLRYNFENLYDISRKLSEMNKESLELCLHAELIKCIKHFEKIMSIIQEHERTFGPVIFFQLNTSGWIICVVAYRLVVINAINLEFICMCMFLLLMIVEFLLYCYYGNEVKYESEGLLNSVYKMDWQETSTAFQKNLLIPMGKFKVAISPSAMKIIPLSLETFVKILQSSYTFYAVINKTQD